MLSTDTIDIDNPDLKNDRLNLYAKLFDLLRRSSEISRYSSMIERISLNEIDEYKALYIQYLNSKPITLKSGCRFLIPATIVKTGSNLQGYYLEKNNISMRQITFNPHWVFYDNTGQPYLEEREYPPFEDISNGKTYRVGIWDDTSLLYVGKDQFFGKDGQYATWGISHQRTFNDWYFWDDSSLFLPEDISAITDFSSIEIVMQPNIPPVGTTYLVDSTYSSGDFSGYSGKIAIWAEDWIVSDASYTYTQDNTNQVVMFSWYYDNSNTLKISTSNYLLDPVVLFDEGKEKTMIIPLPSTKIFEYVDSSTRLKLKIPSIFNRTNQKYTVSSGADGIFEGYSGKDAEWFQVYWNKEYASNEEKYMYPLLSTGARYRDETGAIKTRSFETDKIIGDICIIDTTSSLDTGIFDYHEFGYKASYEELWIFYDSILDNESYIKEKIQEYERQELIDLCNVLELDPDLGSLAVGEKSKSVSYFKNVIDQPAFSSKDHRRIRRFIVDWYSSLRTFVTQSKRIIDIDNLTTEELNELIISYGFPFPQDIPTKTRKLEFLRNLINLYKKKGTPEAFVKALELFGLSEVILSEWWIHYDPDKQRFLAKSNVVLPNDLPTYYTFELVKEYDDFKLMAEPYWQLTESQLESYFEDPLNRASLPSLTSFISIESATQLSSGSNGGIISSLSIMQRKLNETLHYWMYNTLVPYKDVSSNLIDFENFITITNTEPTGSNKGDYIYVIGDSPDANWIVYDRTTNDYYLAREKLKYFVVWDSSSNKWILDERNYMGTGTYYVFSSDSEMFPNSLGIYYLHDSTQNIWKADISIQKDTIIGCKNMVLTGYSSIYNYGYYIFDGSSWIEFCENTDSSQYPNYFELNLNNTQNTKKYINRDMALSSFSNTYSFAEVMLAISYIFDGSKDPLFDSTSNQYQWQYNGEYVPLDNSNFSDDIDEFSLTENGYTPIINEFTYITEDKGKGEISYPPGVIPFRHDNRNNKWQNEIETYITDESGYYFNYDTSQRELRITPRDIGRNKDKLLREKFSVRTDDNYSQIGIEAQLSSENFLAAINPEFKAEIDTEILIDSDVVLETLLLDLEYYMRYNMGILDGFFTYAILGGSFFRKSLSPVVDFFKPFKTQLLSFNTVYNFDDSLLDSVNIEDKLLTSETLQFFDDKIGSDRKRVYGDLSGLGRKDLLINDFKFDETFRDYFYASLNLEFYERTTGIRAIPTPVDYSSDDEDLYSKLDSLRMEEFVDASIYDDYSSYSIFDDATSYYASEGLDPATTDLDSDGLPDCVVFYSIDWILKHSNFDLALLNGIDRGAFENSFKTNRLALFRCNSTDVSDTTEYILRRDLPYIDDLDIEREYNLGGAFLTTGSIMLIVMFDIMKGYTFLFDSYVVNTDQATFLLGDSTMSGCYFSNDMTSNVEYWNSITPTNFVDDCSTYMTLVLPGI